MAHNTGPDFKAQGGRVFVVNGGDPATAYHALRQDGKALCGAPREPALLNGHPLELRNEGIVIVTCGGCKNSYYAG